MAQTYRIMTFNIRYASPNDGENIWEKRASSVGEIMQKSQASIILVQEALNFQLDYIQQYLGGWPRLGVGRDDGAGGGEHCAILYDPREWQWLENDTFWLSETPNEPGSISWNSSLPRICTWAKMRNRHNSEIYVFNTHFDHKSAIARKNAARLIKKYIENLSPEIPVVLAGDFNESLHDKALKELQNQNFLTSAWSTIHPKIKKPGTFHNFTGMKNGVVIDHILINKKVNICDCKIDRQQYQNRYPSDHFPIILNFTL